MTANGACREAFPLIVIKRNPKMFTGEIRLHAEAKSKILEKWGYTLQVTRVCERLGVSQRDSSRVKCRWRRFRDDKWSRKGWSGLERKEAKETIARGQTLERINAKNGIVFYSWKNTDLRQLQLFADNFKWLLVVEFSLTDSPCLFFTLERAESLGLKCSFWRIEIFPGKLLRLLYHSKNYKNSVCQ